MGLEMKEGLHTVIGVALMNVLAAVAFSAASSTPSLAAAIPVATYHYNNSRAGSNTSETILTPANVSVNQFGKLFSLPVDGGIYAQPLYVPNLTIPGSGTHNVVYVATQHNSLYAFDADNGANLWSKNLGPYQPAPQNCTEPGDIGIIGTPVIQSNTIFAVAATLRSGTPQQELHALDITTGAERSSSPVVITASVPGTGFGSVGGILTFNALTEFQRPALLLDYGVLYIGFAAHCDDNAYSAQGHGWLFAYNTKTLHLNSSFVVTPNGFGGGIWASGGGPAVDAYHNIYFSTGDGTFDVDQGGIDYGDSVIKLSSSTLSLLDYFTPYNQAILEANGGDLGSGGILILPDQGTSPTHLLMTAGKAGFIYLINRDNLGQYNTSRDNVVQENGQIVGLFSTPAMWQNRLYFVGSGYTGGDYPKAFSLSRGRMSNYPTSQATLPYPYPGAVPVVSANGATNGILWALQHGGTASGNEVLHAYDATNLAHELYNSEQAGNRDLPGLAGRQFESIIVVNGKVYVPTAQPQLSVFGLLPRH
jgi:outer membrane protein assembly factor BamB